MENIIQDYFSMVDYRNNLFSYIVIFNSKLVSNLFIRITSVPWAYGAKPGSKDTWEGFQEEREEIFSYIEDKKIDGCVLLSADRHRSDLWKIERDNGYDFYEVESSKLTNYHTHEVLDDSLFGYNEKCSFGLLKIDTTKTDPELTYEIINIDGNSVYNLEITRSKLEFS